MKADESSESGFAFSPEEVSALASAGLSLTMVDDAEWYTRNYREDGDGWTVEGQKLHCFCNDLGMIVVHH